MLEKTFSLKSLTIAISLLGYTVPAVAYPISVTPAKGDQETLIKAKLDTDKIGMMKIPRGTVKFKEGKLSVGAVPDWLFDRHVILTGDLLRSQIEGSDGQTQIKGLAYFNRGDWLNNLDNRRSRDNLILDTGVILVGKLRAVNKDTVDFQLTTGQVKRVKKEKIEKLVSPRAFLFEIPTANVKIDAQSGELTGEANNIVFNPTVNEKKGSWFARKKPVEPKSFLAGTEGGVSKAQLSAMIFLDITNTIAPLVIAPIVASPLGTRSADRQLNEFDQFENILIQSKNTVVIP